MGKPAARVGDMHVCPMVTPGLPPIPHVGGPITGPGVPTVLIGGMPAAVMSDRCTCVGPPDTLVLGSTGVFFGGKPAARMGDQCAHGGAITVGLPTVLVGETGSGGGGGGFGGMPTVVLERLLQSIMPASLKQTLAQIIAMREAAVIGIAKVPAQAPIKKPPQKAPPQKIEKGKIGFTLVDEDGNPMANINYEIKTPDGGTRKGKTDKDGKVMEEGVSPGTCKISFPDIHSDEWY